MEKKSLYNCYNWAENQICNSSANIDRKKKKQQEIRDLKKIKSQIQKEIQNQRDSQVERFLNKK